jgi:hypothetical protein
MRRLIVSDAMFAVNSDTWLPALKDLCLDFEKYLKNWPGGQYLKFRDFIGTEENPGTIVKEYHKTLKCLKQEIYGKQADKSLIDHHKIAALYIRSFLIYQPFYLDIPEEIQKPQLCLKTKLPNEYFAIPFLAAIFKSWKEDFDRKLKLEPIYRGNFIKLLYDYKKDISKLNPYSLANIIFLIEKCYFEPSEDAKVDSGPAPELK